MDEISCVDCFRLLVILISSHLSGLKCIFQSASQSCSLFRSSCRDAASSSVLMGRYKRQSSAKRRALAWTLDGRSLMYARNSRGPSTVPWGTPDVTGAELDDLPSTTTFWVLLDRKLFYPLKGCPSNSIVFQLDQKTYKYRFYFVQCVVLLIQYSI